MQNEVNVISRRDILIENEKILINKLKQSEEQIKNGNVKDGDIVLAEMRKKYGY